jgi:hypothetical protein
VKGTIYKYYFFAADKERIDELALDPSELLNAIGEGSSDELLEDIRLMTTRPS